MTLDEILRSISDPAPPAGLTRPVQALWWDHREDWSQAHDVVSEDQSAAASWVHAYLHRKEGDSGNAAYWYRKAGQRPSTATLEEERRQILTSLLAS